MVEVIPALLEQDFAAIEKKIHLIEGLVKWIQIDLADATLVANTTFLDPEPFAEIIKKAVDERQNPLNFELHLMVADPLRYLERFASVGFKRFFAHLEGDFVEDYIAKCYQLGVEVGLAIDGPTPLEKIYSYLDNLDAVLVMAIEAGESGRPFREDTVTKIKKIREVNLEIPIAVDGAMNPENAAKVITAGATRINSNSYLFSSENIKETIESLREIS